MGLSVNCTDIPRPRIENFIQAMNQLGVQTSNDQASSAVGVFYLPNSLNPMTMTRSFTRPDDHDVAVERANYHLLAGNQVTKILTEDAAAYGVEVRHSALPVLARGDQLIH